MSAIRVLHRFASLLGLYGVIATSLVCCGLLVGRLVIAGDGLFRFLIWNLGLAWVPFVLSAVMVGVDRLRRVRWVLMPGLLLAWMLFLPNAPYLLTDLIHLKNRAPFPLWYDTAMLGMFACTGMLLGVRSLAHVHRIVQLRLGAVAGWLFAAQVTLLCGLGIYLGRFLRWNTWDIATRPEALLADLLERLMNPTSHPQTWGVTLVFGLSMLAMHIAARPTPPRAAASR